MKKQTEHERVCALCEYSVYMEYDEQYLCQYKNRCAMVEDTDTCRHFRFDLLKLRPAPKLPYKTEEDIEIVSVPGKTDIGE
mgnify:CR=1 FL=1